ncbi:MAG: pyruvate kinase [Actinobacteria bacterium]|nr:MAG: pyruvate kinase [Actinomycetota bacterium]
MDSAMYRHTKIIATLGPAVADAESVDAMVGAGMDVARLNFSHGDHDLHRTFAGWVRDAAKRHGKSVAIVQDIQGPKLRVGTFPEGQVHLSAGSAVELSPSSGEGNENVIPCGYASLLDDVQPGDRVVLADGLITLKVHSIDSDTATAEVVQGGELSDHKGVAFPDSELSVETITEKDERDLEFGKTLGVEYVAASFVRNGEDVSRVRELADDVPIIAKIELAQAYENLDSILDQAEAIMVARGDLGVQLPLQRLPLIQNDILKRSNAAGRISITATEMLESMIQSPRPTRAEVTDVANAVFGGTDAVMLSGETAIGSYPIKAIEAMALICLDTEQGTLSLRGSHPVPFVGDGNTVASAVAQAATEIAVNVDAKMIVAFTESGNTARLISKYRPEVAINAFTPNPATERQMALMWGVLPHPLDRRVYTDEEISTASRYLESQGLANRGDRVVMVAGVPPGVRASTNLVKVHEIGEDSGGMGS